MIAGLFAAPVAAKGLSPEAVAETYAKIAQAMYEDSLTAAQNLRTAVARLIAEPSNETLTEARRAWLAARVPYQQTEGPRFGNPVVDDWEGRVNAWPLDEGLIDYAGQVELPDVCGIAPAEQAGKFVVTSGFGDLARLRMTEAGPRLLDRTTTRYRWDNHLTVIAGG